MPKGFVTKSSAPASSAATLSASRSRTDRTTMGTSVQPRRPSITSSPSMPGRPRSRITASGRCRCASVSAASPVPARSTA